LIVTNGRFIVMKCGPISDSHGSETFP
jgi:hypothetical protein